MIGRGRGGGGSLVGGGGSQLEVELDPPLLAEQGEGDALATGGGRPEGPVQQRWRAGWRSPSSGARVTLVESSGAGSLCSASHFHLD